MKMRRMVALVLGVIIGVAAMPSVASAATQTTEEMRAEVLHQLGLLAGSGNGDQLHSKLNRVEAITMLIHMMGEDQAVQNGNWSHPFEDVPQWAQSYVGYAYVNGLSSGISETQFGSDRDCSQAQYLTFLLRALGYSDSRGQFQWDQPYALAKAVGLITSETPLRRFSRGDMVDCSYRALQAQMYLSSGGEGVVDSLQNQQMMLKDHLIAKGVFTQDTYQKAMAVYAEGPKEVKAVYLTFDDGPSKKVTPQVLNMLRQYGVPATFFVVGKQADLYPGLVRDAYYDGHKIASHGYSHDYKYLYAKKENLVSDIKKGNESIDKALGFAYNNKIFRFPGGSFGKSQELKDAVKKAGYTYYDWNCSGEDATKKKGSSTAEIVDAAIATSAGKKGDIIVLLHDASTKGTTAEALPKIIQHFRDQGYVFRTLQ